MYKEAGGPEKVSWAVQEKGLKKIAFEFGLLWSFGVLWKLKNSGPGLA